MIEELKGYKPGVVVTCFQSIKRGPAAAAHLVARLRQAGVSDLGVCVLKVMAVGCCYLWSALSICCFVPATCQRSCVWWPAERSRFSALGVNVVLKLGERWAGMSCTHGVASACSTQHERRDPPAHRLAGKPQVWHAIQHKLSSKALPS